MPSIAAETLARLRVCRDSGRQVPPDLVESAIGVIEGMVRADVLRERRDEMLRRAALLLPEQRPYAQAGQLFKEARAMDRVWHVLRTSPADDRPATIRACLRAARNFAPLPASQRHFYRILTAGRN